jgi:hypothetical protein
VGIAPLGSNFRIHRFSKKNKMAKLLFFYFFIFFYCWLVPLYWIFISHTILMMIFCRAHTVQYIHVQYFAWDLAWWVSA